MATDFYSLFELLSISSGAPGVVRQEKNVADQDMIRLNLWTRHGIKMARFSLDDVHQKGVVTKAEDSGRSQNILRVDGQEIAVAYFRAGYTPDDYKEEVCVYSSCGSS